MCYTGEIEVRQMQALSVLNQAFQATATVHGMRKPTVPVVLDIDEDIKQLIILRKRTPIDEYAEEEMQRRRQLADFLGVDFLEFDGLDGDALKDSIEGIWKTHLDETDFMLA
jgi:hypothetical protein